MTYAPSEYSDQPGHPDQSLRCRHEETLGPQLPIECTAKTLIRLGGCPVWSVFAGRTYHLVAFVMRRLIYLFPTCSCRRGLTHISLVDLSIVINWTSLCHLYMDRVKRIWYLSPMRAAKVQASLRIRTVSPEPPLLAQTSRESRGTFRQKARSLAPLNGWACAVTICHDGMLEDTNSLEGAHIYILFCFE